MIYIERFAYHCPTSVYLTFVKVSYDVTVRLFPVGEKVFKNFEFQKTGTVGVDKTRVTYRLASVERDGRPRRG